MGMVTLWRLIGFMVSYRQLNHTLPEARKILMIFYRVLHQRTRVEERQNDLVAWIVLLEITEGDPLKSKTKLFAKDVKELDKGHWSGNC